MNNNHYKSFGEFLNETHQIIRSYNPERTSDLLQYLLSKYTEYYIPKMYFNSNTSNINELVFISEFLTKEEIVSLFVYKYGNNGVNFYDPLADYKLKVKFNCFDKMVHIFIHSNENGNGHLLSFDTFRLSDKAAYHISKYDSVYESFNIRPRLNRVKDRIKQKRQRLASRKYRKKNKTKLKTNRKKRRKEQLRRLKSGVRKYSRSGYRKTLNALDKITPE